MSLQNPKLNNNPSQDPKDFTKSTRKSIENSVETQEQWLQFNRSKPSQKFLSQIHSGVFGSVQKMYDFKNQRIVAVKRKVKNKKQESRETDQLSHLRKSQNVVNVQDVFYTGHENYKNAIIQNIAMEYMPTSLQKVMDTKLNNGERFTSTEIKVMFQQLINGLREMHALDIAHRDIKPDNILVKPNDSFKETLNNKKNSKKGSKKNEDNETTIYKCPELPQIAKIADVGCAKALSTLPLYDDNLHSCAKNSMMDDTEQGNLNIGNSSESSASTKPVVKKKHTVVARVDMLQTPHCISLWQRPPELLAGVTDQTTKVDMWSAGCLLQELYSLKSLFKSENEGMQMAVIFERLGTPPKEILKKQRFVNPMMFNEVIAKLPIVKGSGLDKDMHDLLGVSKMDRKQADEAKEEIRLMLDLSYNLMESDPEARLSAEQALTHEYFNSVRHLFPHVEADIRHMQ